MKLPWKRSRPEREPEDLAPVFARVFRGDDGDTVLEHLAGMSMDQAAGPGVSDARLRHLEGQRFMVRYIVNMVERGRNG